MLWRSFMRRALPIVTTLIAAPCDVPWDTMTGDHRTRHCAACKRDVHNLSAMTSAEAEAFMYALAPSPIDGHVPCISVFQRTDGTILTTDCPIGLTARRRRSLLIATLSIGSVALLAMSGLATVWLTDRDAAAAADEPSSYVEPPPVLVPAKPVAIYPPPQVVQPVFVAPPATSGTARGHDGIRMAGAPVMRGGGALTTTAMRKVRKKNAETALQVLEAAMAQNDNTF